MVTQYTTENLRDLKKLEGTWVCIRSENVEELLIELGISFILRQLVNCSKSCQDIIVRGTEVDITYDVGFCSNKMTVKLGEEVEVMRLNVRHKCMSRFEDGKLIVTQTPLNSEVKEQVIHRELTGEELIMTVFVGSVKCKRIFKRKTSDDELPLIRRRPANCCLMKLFAPKSDEK